MATKKRQGMRAPREASVRRSQDQSLNAREPRLIPALRTRLFALTDEANIAPEARVPYLSSLTGRAPQTVRRWLRNRGPGLPDLPSVVSLCIRFNIDANWLLGLTNIKFKLPAADTDQKAPDRRAWLDHIARQVAQKAPRCEVFYMPGDEMEPKIEEGAPILVDTSIREIDGNGIYLLEYERRTIVRTVENRIGEGFVLACENKKYQPTVIKGAAAAKKLGLTVIGKAEFWIQLTSA